MGQIAFLTAIVLALVPAAASAAGTNCQAPAGTSGIDQYCEVLPRGGGTGSSGHHKKKAASPVFPRPPRRCSTRARPARPSSPSRSRAAPRRQLRLRRRPPRSRRTSSHKAAAVTQSGSQTPPSAPKPSVAGPKGPVPGNDPFSAVGNSVSVGSAMSAGFVWVLVGIALILGAMAWLSYRTRRHETS